MTIKAAAYKRTHPEADARMRAAENQLVEAIRYADTNGLYLAEFFTDVSAGYGDRRPGLMAMLAAMDAGEFDALIVEGLDRLSRHPGEANAIARRLRAAGIEIHIINDDGVALPDTLSSRRLH